MRKRFFNTEELPPGLFHTEPGWYGAFTRAQDPAALYENGARIYKVAEDKGDATPLGTAGLVLGSISYPGAPTVGYFVEWDNRTQAAVFVVEWKIAAMISESM